MSRFPRRLLDELGDGPSRRLLEQAGADAPPPDLVATAIAAATRGARADERSADSSAAPAASSSRRGIGRMQLAAIAGALLAGGMLVWIGRNEHPSTTTTEPPAPALSIGDPPVAPVPNPASDNGNVNVPATSVADLPEAPTPTPTISPRPSTPVTVVSPSPPRAEESADLLREANRLRAQGRWAEAAATYRKVIDLGPTSAEAYPADVALGNLELQQGRPLAALERYEHALRSHPSGALGEEARWGKARAFRAAGRTSEERAALREFQSKHPDSPLAPAATARLAEIEK